MVAEKNGNNTRHIIDILSRSIYAAAVYLLFSLSRKRQEGGTSYRHATYVIKMTIPDKE